MDTIKVKGRTKNCGETGYGYSADFYATGAKESRKMFSDYPLITGEIEAFVSEKKTDTLKSCGHHYPNGDIRTCGFIVPETVYQACDCMFGLQDMGFSHTLSVNLSEQFDIPTLIKNLMLNGVNMFLEASMLSYDDLMEFNKIFKPSISDKMYQTCIVVSILNGYYSGTIDGKPTARQLSFVPMNEVVGKLNNLVPSFHTLESYSLPYFKSFIQEAVDIGEVQLFKDPARGSDVVQCALRSVYMCERAISRRLRYSGKDLKPLDIDLGGIKDLDDNQIKIFDIVNKNRVSFLTGGPGVGKTHTLCRLVNTLIDEGYAVACVSPTAKAARRMKELLGTNADREKEYKVALDALAGMEPTDEIKDEMACVSAMIHPTTIHKLLRKRGSGITCRKSEFTVDLVVVDESSMVGSFMISELLKFIPNDGRILFVGDHNQLPPVDGGAPLRDIYSVMKDGYELPYIYLDHCYRTDGAIVLAARQIINKERVNGSLIPGHHHLSDICVNKSYVKQFNVISHKKGTKIEIVDPQDLEDRVVEIYSALVRSGYDHNDMQILCAVNANVAGVDSINKRIQAEFSRSTFGRERSFYSGDKVVCTKNQDNNDLVNGDVGIVRSFDGKELCCDFYGKEYVINKNNGLRDIKLAYALTVHKAQGSEYRVVLFVANQKNTQGLFLSLVYTGITRAKSCCMVVSSTQGFHNGIKNDIRESRKTLLCGFLEDRYEEL